MAAKKTTDLVALCHLLTLARVAVECIPDEQASSVTCSATVETVGPTGVNMRALTAMQNTPLPIDGTCKAIDRQPHAA